MDKHTKIGVNHQVSSLHLGHFRYFFSRPLNYDFISFCTFLFF